MRPLRSSVEASSRGFTLMIVGGPGQAPRRLFVPHWLCASLLVAWLGVLLLAAWFGFQHGAHGAAQSPAPTAPTTTGAPATASTGAF